MAGPAAPNASIGSAILAQVQHAASSSKEVGASSPTGRPAQRGKAPEVNGRSKSKKKGKAKAAAGGEQSKQHSSANGKPRQEPDGVDAGSPSRREVLLQEIKALGGTEEDLDLVGSGSDDGSEEGITRIDGADAPHDPKLMKDLKAFMKGLDFSTGSTGALPTTEPAPSKEQQTAAASAALTSLTARTDDPAEEAKRAKKEARKEQRRINAERKRKAEGDEDKDVPPKPLPVQTRVSEDPRPKGGKATIPSWPVWYDTTDYSELPEASASTQALSEEAISALAKHGEEILSDLSDRFAASLEPTSANPGGATFLSTSDKAFVGKILSSGTASDRLSALLLLVSSAPLHSGRTYLTTLLGICRKKNRDEAGRAMRGLIDWLRGRPGPDGGNEGGGLPNRKLKHFRDQPALARLAALRKRSTKGDGKRGGKFGQPGDDWLALWTFEDWMKRWYLDVLRVIENFSVDTVAHVRSQSVTYSFLLLHDKPEQEQNLLRLLSNKLGDGDRSVASRASYHLLQILQSHPGMRAIVVNEVASLVLRPITSAPSKEGSTAGDASTKRNDHARYYGTITLNQITLSRADADVANKLVEVYFEIFKDILGDAPGDDGPVEEPGQVTTSAPPPRRKADKKKATPAPIETDSTSRLTAAILTGLNRAFPYASTEDALMERHVDTLFRIVHGGASFNVGVQALVLIQHIVAARTREAAKSSGPPGGDDPAERLASRFFRALYGTLVDPRLVTSSKQAMYLNLLFKAIRADAQPRRVCAFVKRVVQVLPLHQPPFICGTLYLLGELFAAVPGLRELSAKPGDPDEAGVYDGRKRDPAFAGAESSRLWELGPLLEHYHPSVSLNARQLQEGVPVTASADLDQHTLNRFLERFVHRDPAASKKTSTQHARLRGPSAMQPAASAGHDRSGLVLSRARDPADRSLAHPSARTPAELVKADEMFFYLYTKAKEQRQGEAERASRRRKGSASGSEGGAPGELDDEEGDEEGSDGFDEDEVWRAMKSTMPRMVDDGPDVDESDGDQDEPWDLSSSSAVSAAAAAAEGIDDEDPSHPGDPAGEIADLRALRRAEPSDLVAEQPDDEDEDDEDDDLRWFDPSSAEDDDGGVDVSWDRGGRSTGSDVRGKRSQTGSSKRRRVGDAPVFADADDYAAMVDAD